MNDIQERTPVVSIGMPVRNGEKYLAAALDSLLSQTYTDFEIVISDNCSTDGTRSICQEYAARDARIRYVLQTENLGSAGNFNYVFHASRGKYFKWAAHDDLCEPEFLAKCVDLLDSNPRLIWCHTRSDMIDAEGQTWLDQLPEDSPELTRQPDGSLWWESPPRASSDSDRPHRRFAGVLLGTNWCVDSYGLIRSSALRKTRLFMPMYGSEKILMGELSLMGKYGHCPEVLFAQRIHADASSSLDTGAAQDAFAANARNRPPLVTRLLLLKAHFNSVMNADLRWLEKLRCLAVVIRYLFQVKKWRRIVGTLMGTGVGGGGKRMLDARRKPPATTSALQPNHEREHHHGDPLSTQI